jgi:serine/threonine protein kinase
MDYYEVISILGEGSMGSVSKVKRRTDTLGGSSRLDYVQREAQKKIDALREENYCAFILQRLMFPLQDCWHKHVDKKRPSILTSQHSSALERMTSNMSSSSASRHRTVYALKSIHLGQSSDPGLMLEMENEINLLQQMDHPNIVKAMETFEHQHHLVIVLELCDGGDLYSRDPYTEKNACSIIQQISSAVAYMHAKNVSHRDLKL